MCVVKNKQKKKKLKMRSNIGLMKKNNTLIKNRENVENCDVLGSVLSQNNQANVQPVIVLL